jgi:hypothetical protein
MHSWERWTSKAENSSVGFVYNVQEDIFWSWRRSYVPNRKLWQDRNKTKLGRKVVRAFQN